VPGLSWFEQGFESNSLLDKLPIIKPTGNTNRPLDVSRFTIDEIRTSFRSFNSVYFKESRVPYLLGQKRETNIVNERDFGDGT
jgi:hypothetical protein